MVDRRLLGLHVIDRRHLSIAYSFTTVSCGVDVIRVTTAAVYRSNLKNIF